MSQEIILVTGGAGFIGSHIVDTFIQAGHRVVVVDNLSTGRRANLNPAATFYELDIRDAAGLLRVFTAERPTVVCHQAAMADVRDSLQRPATYAEVNVIGTLNLLEASRHSGSVRKFLFASTGGAIYGNPQELPASETCPAAPLDPYGASKIAGEYFIATYHHNYGLAYCCLRYGNVYGPRQNPEGEAGVVAIFCGRMLRNQPAIINGPGTQARDFVYVGDVARANLLAVEHGSGIYNVGTGIPTDINMIFRKLAELTGYTRPEKHGSAKLGEVDQTYLNASRARRDLDWLPQVSLAEGLAHTAAHFRDDLG